MSSLGMGRTEPSSPNRKHLVEAMLPPTQGRPLRGRGAALGPRKQGPGRGTRAHPVRAVCQPHARAFPTLATSLPGWGWGWVTPSPMAGAGRSGTRPRPPCWALCLRTSDLRAGQPEPAGSTFPRDALTGSPSRGQGRGFVIPLTFLIRSVTSGHRPLSGLAGRAQQVYTGACGGFAGWGRGVRGRQLPRL